MELHEAQMMTQKLMGEYGLNAKGWTFSFDRAKKRLGCCWGGRKKITLSAYYTLLNDETVIKEVILHEIAHALVGCQHGHNHVWKNKMRELGLRPNRTFDVENGKSPEGKYIYKCNNCETTVHKHRKTKKVYACADCCRKYNGGRYSPEFIFWQQYP